jgi:O-antigen ligase
MDLQLIVPLLYPAAWLAFALSFKRPEVGVYYLTLILPLQTLRYQLQGYLLGAQIVDLVLFGVLIGLWINGRLELSTFSMRGILLLVSVYSYLSLWWGSYFLGCGMPISLADPRFAVWREWAEFGVICALTFAAIKTVKQIQTVLFLMSMTAFLLSWDFFQTVSAHDVSRYSWNLRYSGVLGYANANGFAAFETMFILLLLGLVGSGLSTKLKLLIGPALIACSYGLLFAFSRGAYLGFACGTIVLGALRRKFLTVLVFAALAACFLLPSAVSDRIGATYTVGEATTEKTLDNSAEERVVLWQIAIDVISAHPLLGTGFNTFAFMHPLGFKDTHNLYLKVLLEQGAVGFVLFLVMLSKMIRQGYDLFRRSTDPFLASLGLGFTVTVVGALIMNVFGDRWSYLQVDSYLWILLALVCRGRLLSSEPQTQFDNEAMMPLHPASAQA